MKDRHEISEETKKKVLEASKNFNHTPNPYASSLRRKTSKTIAVILPEVADNFFSLAINGIQSIAEAKGYQFNLYMINLDGTGLEQITFDPVFDSFPMFSPDGKRLVWSSNRNNHGTHDTNLFKAEWVE